MLSLFNVKNVLFSHFLYNPLTLQAVFLPPSPKKWVGWPLLKDVFLGVLIYGGGGWGDHWQITNPNAGLVTSLIQNLVDNLVRL